MIGWSWPSGATDKTDEVIKEKGAKFKSWAKLHRLQSISASMIHTKF